MSKFLKAVFVISLLLNVFFLAFAYNYVSRRNISYLTIVYRIKEAFTPPSKQNYIKIKEPAKEAQKENFCDASYEEIDKYLSGKLSRQYVKKQIKWPFADMSVDNFKIKAALERENFKKFLCIEHPLEKKISCKEKDVLNNDLNRIMLVSVDYLPGVNVYGLLMLPRCGRPPYPAVIVLHGYGGSPEHIAGFKHDYHSEIGKKLIERGYAIFAPYFVHGEKDFTKRRNILHEKALSMGENFEGIEIGKIMRAVDYLQSLPEINKEKIGVYGISVGGRYSLYSAAADERIKAVVLSGWFNDRFKKMFVSSDKYSAYIFSDEFNCFHFNQIEFLSDTMLAALIVPRPLFIEQGIDDPYVNIDTAKEEFEKAKKVYTKLNAGDEIKFGAFHGIHQIHAWDAIKFLDKYLK